MPYPNIITSLFMESKITVYVLGPYCKITASFPIQVASESSTSPIVLTNWALITKELLWIRLNSKPG